MSFDAGEIRAKLVLDRAQFEADLEEVKANADKPIEVKVKPQLDKTAVEEVLAEEEPLRSDIEPEVKPQYSKAEAESVGRTLASDILGAMSSGGGFGGGATGGPWDSVLGAVMFTPAEMDAALQRFIAELGSGPGLTAPPIMLESLIGDMFGAGAGPLAITAAMTNAGFTGEAIALSIENVMGDAAATSEVAVRRDFVAMFQQAISGAPGLLGAMSFGSGPMAAIFNPLGLAAGTAFLGAFGLALGGGIAGTGIGLAGVFAAVLPGFLDLQKGMAAYSALQAGTSTKGMSSGALGLGKGLQGLIGAGSKGLGAAESTVMPDITKFIAALTKAVPLMNEFAKPAIKAMSGFFDAIDKGMGSKGFKGFVDTMSKDVGPIMNDFGQVILNLGGTLGGFLKLFGGAAADTVGGWFVKITGELDKFVNHVKLGHGFVKGMVTVFSNLGKILPAVAQMFKTFGPPLAAVGLQIFRIMGWMATWIGRVVKLIPPWLAAAIVALGAALTVVAAALVAVGFALTKLGIEEGIGAFASDVLSTAMIALGGAIDVATGPVGLIVLAIVALGVGIYELVKHWKTVWGDIKKWFGDAVKFLSHGFGQLLLLIAGPLAPLLFLALHWKAVWNDIKTVAQVVWNFLDRDIFQPIADFFVSTFKKTLTGFKQLWDIVWNGIAATVKTIWKILKPIFDTISGAIKTITGGIGSVSGLASKVGGGLLHAAGSFLGGIVHAVTGVRASGGPVNAGGSYLVGEQGPELFVPSTAGTVVPSGQFGSSRQQIIFQIDARGQANPQETAGAVRNAITASFPSLQAALARGAA